MTYDENAEAVSDIFREPEGYFKAEQLATHTEATLLSGQKLRLRLVGHNPLWARSALLLPNISLTNDGNQGHYVWNGAQILSQYLQQHAARLVRGKTILELGAGAGLPSLVAGILDARNVVVTDYPDADLIDNLKYNIDTCRLLPQPVTNITAKGYLWGAPVDPLQLPSTVPAHGFDTLLLADLLFNHHCHDALVCTVLQALAHTPDARALVFFTPYRPWLLDKDMDFLDLCTANGLLAQKVVENVMDHVMFEDDKGDELLRRTVFGYELRWDASRDGEQSSGNSRDVLEAPTKDMLRR